MVGADIHYKFQLLDHLSCTWLRREWPHAGFATQGGERRIEGVAIMPVAMFPHQVPGDLGRDLVVTVPRFAAAVIAAHLHTVWIVVSGRFSKPPFPASFKRRHVQYQW